MGAEVVIDTAEQQHKQDVIGVENTLSVNQQVPNGMIPDVVLPFNVTKGEAKENK